MIFDLKKIIYTYFSTSYNPYYLYSLFNTYDPYDV